MTQFRARQWVYTVATQGRRVIAAGATTTQSSDLERTMWARSEEHFFAVAVGKALDWLGHLESHSPQLKPAIGAFRDAVPHARELRNMLEHDDEYLQGHGHSQEDFLRSVEGHEMVSAVATSTVILERRYLIGGRLEVDAAVAAAEALLPALVVR